MKMTPVKQIFAHCKPLFQCGALIFALCMGSVLASAWLTGCSGGSGGTGVGLGEGLPTGGGGGGPNGGGGGGGGGGNGVPTPTPIPECGGGTLSGTFTGVAAANADTTTFSATKVRGAALNAGANASSFTLTGTLCNPPAAGNRSVTIKVNQPLTAGATYTLSSGSTGNSFLQYLESTTNGDQTVEKSWTATAATLTVQSITGQTVIFRIQNAAMAPDPDFFTSNATGTFNLSVTGSVTAINGL